VRLDSLVVSEKIHQDLRRFGAVIRHNIISDIAR
jgi:hypothetical protein